MGQVLDFNVLLQAKQIADEFRRVFSGDIEKAKRAGYKLRYRLDVEEQIGRGKLFVAIVVLVPEGHSAKRKCERLGQAYMQAEARYEEPPDAIKAIKEAVECVLDFASDHRML